MAVPVIAEGSVIGGDYRVVRPLGSGGMGAVYVAEQLSTGRQRAVKVLHSSLVSDDKRCERFLREARISAKIASDNVVEVVGAGVDPKLGLPWIAMELLDGDVLTRILERYKVIPPAGVLEIAAQLCDALGRAHAVGIIHADLKPDNLFIAVSRRRGATFEVKILDFGIARLSTEQTEAKATAPMGSPMWMAPEQAQQGFELTPATDVWALGLLVFNLLTGRPYWLAANVPDEQLHPTAILMEMMIGEIVSGSARARTLGVFDPLPSGFDAWLSRCVCRDAAGRFANATLAWESLEKCLQPAPVAQRPAPAPDLAATQPVVLPPRAFAPPPMPPLAPSSPSNFHSMSATRAAVATGPLRGAIAPGTPVMASWGGAPNARGVALEVNAVTSLVRVRFDDGYEGWVALSLVRART